jgi:transcriptional regulator with XRE-family HTH domain
MINSFGQKVKELRNETGLGSRELSRRIGKTETYVSQLERGVLKKIDFPTGYILLKGLGLNERDILNILDEYGIHAVDTREYRHAKSVQIVQYKLTEVNYNWFDKEVDELKEQIQIISGSLINFVEKDLTRAKKVINNFYHIINTDKDCFEFFCELFGYDYTQINSSEKSFMISEIARIFQTIEKNT